MDCRDHDAKDIDPSTVRTAPDFCLIDGEHTHAAVLSDFEFCRKVAATDAVICFHDDIVIWRVLREIEASLRSRKLPFTSRKFGVPVYGCTYGIFLGSCAVATDPTVLANSVEGGAWLRTRQLRSYVPGPLKAAARWCSGLLKRPARVA